MPFGDERTTMNFVQYCRLVAREADKTRATQAKPMPSNDIPLPPLEFPLSFTRKIRACEGDAAAQLLLEKFAIAYARSAVIAAIERCAQIADELEQSADDMWDMTADPTSQGESKGACAIAAAIRALSVSKE